MQAHCFFDSPAMSPVANPSPPAGPLQPLGLSTEVVDTWCGGVWSCVVNRDSSLRSLRSNHIWRSILFWFDVLIDCKQEVGRIGMGKLKVVSPDFALPWFSIQWLQVIGHQIIKMWNVDPFPSFLAWCCCLPTWFSPKSLQFDTRIMDWTQEALRFLMAFAAEEGHLEDAEAHAMRLLDSSGPEKETGWLDESKFKNPEKEGLIYPFTQNHVA